MLPGKPVPLAIGQKPIRGRCHQSGEEESEPQTPAFQNFLLLRCLPHTWIDLHPLNLPNLRSLPPGPPRLPIMLRACLYFPTWSVSVRVSLRGQLSAHTRETRIIYRDGHRHSRRHWLQHRRTDAQTHRHTDTHTKPQRDIQTQIGRHTQTRTRKHRHAHMQTQARPHADTNARTGALHKCGTRIQHPLVRLFGYGHRARVARCTLRCSWTYLVLLLPGFVAGLARVDLVLAVVQPAPQPRQLGGDRLAV